ncbi:MAG: NAD-dependent epimerase/dehydratase family protein, partial [Acidimicrobiales bacterium]
MTWADRSVLVTGATGFVGSWLTSRLLDEGAEVAVLLAELDSRSEFARAGLADRVTVVPGALDDGGAVARAVLGTTVDTVFHLGAQTIVGTARRDPVGTFEANIRGTYLLLDACRRAAGTVERVVVASSDKAYGASPQLPYTESMALQGTQPYEVSKSCTDLLAQSYAITYGVPVAVARCGNVYGGGDLNWSRIVPGTLRSVLRGEVPLIRSDGTQVRDYLHVHDVVAAYLALADWLDTGNSHSPPGGIAFNFSDESPRTVMDMYDAVCRAVGQEVEPKILG